MRRGFVVSGEAVAPEPGVTTGSGADPVPGSALPVDGAAPMGSGLEPPACRPASGKPGIWTGEAPDSPTPSRAMLAINTVPTHPPTSNTSRRRRPDRSRKTGWPRVGASFLILIRARHRCLLTDLAWRSGVG